MKACEGRSLIEEPIDLHILDGIIGPCLNIHGFRILCLFFMAFILGAVPVCTNVCGGLCVLYFSALMYWPPLLSDLS